MLPNRIEDIVDTSNITEVPQTSPPNIDVDVHIVQRNIMKIFEILVELIYIKQSQIRLISPNYQLTNIYFNEMITFLRKQCIHHCFLT